MNRKPSSIKSLPANSSRLAAAGLPCMKDVIAHSPIRSFPSGGTQALFTDWLKERHSADVDALILAWIASHVQAGAPRTRLH